MAHPMRNRITNRIRLTEKHPRIADDWDYEANGTLFPDDLTVGSETRVWWKCPQGHTWKTSPAARVYRGNKCRACTGRLPKAPRRLKPASPAPGESLAEVDTVLAALWSAALNEGVTPEDVRATSPFVAWWDCARCRKAHQSPVQVATTLCDTCRPPESVACPGCGAPRTEHVDALNRVWRKCAPCGRKARARGRVLAAELRWLHNETHIPLADLASAFDVTESVIKHWMQRHVAKNALVAVDTCAGLTREYLRDQPQPDAEAWTQVWYDQIVSQLPGKQSYKTFRLVEDASTPTGAGRNTAA